MTVQEVSRVASTLVIDGIGSSGRMAPIPDGVDTLLLKFAQSAGYISLDRQTWDRLDCLIVDSAEAVIHLLLRLEPMHRWLVSASGGHLLLTDPDWGAVLFCVTPRALMRHGNSR